MSGVREGLVVRVESDRGIGFERSGRQGRSGRLDSK